MNNSVNIVNGKKGYILKVNGLYINHGFDGTVKAIQNEFGVPYGATEWVSVQAIRQFWAKYMPTVIHSTKYPHKSIWGQLVSAPIES